MTLVCVASAKGAPGATTSALALAAAWPLSQGLSGSGRHDAKVLIEADPSGGSLAIRYRLPANPGLLALAARVGAGLKPEALWASAQPLPGGLPVVLAPDRPDRIATALASIGAPLARWLASQRELVAVVDIGRLSGEPAVRAVLAAADAVVVVARPEAEQLQCVSHLMIDAPAAQRVGWILIGQGTYPPDDVANAYGRPVLAVIPDEPKSVERLYDGKGQSKLRRSGFVRGFATLAARLDGSLVPGPVTGSTAVRPSPMSSGPPPQTLHGPSEHSGPAPRTSDPWSAAPRAGTPLPSTPTSPLTPPMSPSFDQMPPSFDRLPPMPSDPDHLPPMPSPDLDGLPPMPSDLDRLPSMPSPDLDGLPPMPSDLDRLPSMPSPDLDGLPPMPSDLDRLPPMPSSPFDQLPRPTPGGGDGLPPRPLGSNQLPSNPSTPDQLPPMPPPSTAVDLVPGFDERPPRYGTGQ